MWRGILKFIVGFTTTYWNKSVLQSLKKVLEQKLGTWVIASPFHQYTVEAPNFVSRPFGYGIADPKNWISVR